MFQGRNIRVNRVGKNRYEFRSQYSILYGTAPEIAKVISDQTREARQSALELTEAKRLVAAAAAEDGVPLSQESAPPPTAASTCPPAAPAPGRPGLVTTRERTSAPAPKRSRRAHHGLAVVTSMSAPSAPPAAPAAPAEPGRRKPRRYGLAYLNALREQEAAENAQ